jgi:N-acyl-D-aspartate/D-glutamate deacylase
MGKKADVNVIDWDRLGAGAPYVVNDLPAGGKRLLQRVSGYEATIVSGRVTFRDGAATGVLPGRLVRGPQMALAA